MSTFKLVPADPVPSDIEVSQSITPINIATIAANAGILPDELEPYGKYKAKVSLDVRDRLKGQKVGREEKWICRARGWRGAQLCRYVGGRVGRQGGRGG